MKLQLKFKEDASEEQREEVIGGLSANGAKAVPLFPGTTDRVRGSLYIVDLNGGPERQLLTFLHRAEVVEFAEPEVRRKLAR
jgi:hypothetical protein